jgi:signal peptidase I
MKTYTPTTANDRRGIWDEGEISPLSMARETLTPDTQYYWLHPAPIKGTSSTPPAKPRSSWLKKACVIVWLALFSMGCYYLISRYVITAVEIQGRSMVPTLQEGERYFLNRLAYRWKAPARGDLAVIHDPGHADCAVKRIIGLPGDSVWIREGAVYINNERLAEPYLVPGTRTTTITPQTKALRLGPDRYYLLGDNRACSEDSRQYGVIHRSQIVGLISK